MRNGAAAMSARKRISVVVVSALSNMAVSAIDAATSPSRLKMVETVAVAAPLTPTMPRVDMLGVDACMWWHMCSQALRT